MWLWGCSSSKTFSGWCDTRMKVSSSAGREEGEHAGRRKEHTHAEEMNSNTEVFLDFHFPLYIWPNMLLHNGSDTTKHMQTYANLQTLGSCSDGIASNADSLVIKVKMWQQWLCISTMPTCLLFFPFPSCLWKAALPLFLQTISISSKELGCVRILPPLSHPLYPAQYSTGFWFWQDRTFFVPFQPSFL